MDEILKRLAELEARVDDLESQKRGNRFTPPTTDDVRGHCVEKCYTFSPESFVAFYESKNWKVGNAKMKCWKSACVTWQQREVKNGQTQSGSRKLSHADNIREQARRALAEMDAADAKAGNGLVLENGDTVPKQIEQLPDNDW